MDIKEFLNVACHEIKYEPAREAIAEELELHMQEIKEEQMRCGMQEKEAEEKAVLQMGEAKEIGKKLNAVHKPKLDWKLFILLLVLMSFGMLVSILKQNTLNGDYFKTTVLYMLIGIVVGIGIYFFDYKKIKKYSNLIFVMASVLMVLPRLGMGILINGMYCVNVFWINVMPNTIAIPLYIIAFTGYLADYDKNNIFKMQIQNKIFFLKKDFIKVILLMIISMLLMLGMPSLISSMILGFVYLVLITVKIVQSKENRLKKLSLMYGTIAIFAILVIGSNPYRLERIVYSFHPEADPNGYGYTGMLRKEVLENAKLIGEAETRLISSDEYIISLENNYTFIYLVGKTGILVSGGLVLVILLTSLRMLKNSKTVKERYGKLLIIGLGTLYIVQSAISVLMNINLGIETNVSLPFVSFGGIYFIVNMMSIAVIFSIYRRKDINQYE